MFQVIADMSNMGKPERDLLEVRRPVSAVAEN